MRKRNKGGYIIDNLEITGYANEGKAIGKYEGKVVFVNGAMPGDVVDVRVFYNKKDFAEGRIVNFIRRSDRRIEPRCKHFNYCGGCKWQHVPYEEQLAFKEQSIKESFRRIGKVEFAEWLPIIGSANEFFYRNKLEFSFASKSWLPSEVLTDVHLQNQPALGYHIQGFWDKVLPIDECHLQPEPSESIRRNVYRYALEKQLRFYDLREKKGLLRNLMIRVMRSGEVLVLLVFGENDKEAISEMMNFMSSPTFPDITSLNYVINTKKNDTIHDLTVVCHKGAETVTEYLGSLKFRVSPQSFFQTNTSQAEALYQVIERFADLKGTEVVYDLYTGTGSIALFLASHCKTIIGIEYVRQAIDDAKVNASINGIGNANFFTADIADAINDEIFINKIGKPDVVITDPPRAGMHPDVVASLLKLCPQKIVYVSCNPATQARDVELLSEKYHPEKSCPVDMFPHTHHLENVVLLTRK